MENGLAVLPLAASRSNGVIEREDASDERPPSSILRPPSSYSTSPPSTPSTFVAAAANAAVAIGARPSRSSLAALLASHLIPDSETVILVLRPSPWFVPITSFRFLLATVIVTTAAAVLGFQHGHARGYVEAGSSVAAARFAWALLQWTGRLYVLTDRRALTIWGVFTSAVIDCPLRKVADVKLYTPSYEKPINVGSVTIASQTDDCPVSWWWLIDRPKPVYDEVMAAVSRAKRD